MAGAAQKVEKAIMIDLETASTQTNAAILTIGMVCFDPFNAKDPMGEQFYLRIDPKSYDTPAAKKTFDISMDTMGWWMRQSPAAQKEAFHATPRVSVVEGIRQTHQWLKSHCGKLTQMWAHGKDFDLPILQHAFEALGLEVPWTFWMTRDTRTLYDVGKIGKLPATGEDHQAIGDCKKQIWGVVKAYQKLTFVKP